MWDGSGVVVVVALEGFRVVEGLPGRNLGGFEVFGRILCSLRVNVLVRASAEQTNAQGVDKLWISCG